MRVLVTWGSKHGGTAGIAAIVAETLTARGHSVVAVASSEAPPPTSFDAVVVGGALYANRWPREVRRYVEHWAPELSRIPTWLFSSGPLDDSADLEPLSPPRWLRGLGARIGALGHEMFGGRLEADVQGFPAAAMAKQHAGDWRNPARIRAWANELADDLPSAVPRIPITPEGRSGVRLVEYGVVGWGFAAAALVIAAGFAPLWFAVALHAVVMPLWFTSLAVRYQGVDGARTPFVTAIAWVGLAGVLDLALVAPIVAPRFSLGASFVGLWLPLALSFVGVWAAGSIAAMMPLPPSGGAAPTGGAR